MRRLALHAACAVAFVLSLSGCSREVDSPVLGIRYEPLASMKFVSADVGPPATGTFEGGLRVYSVPGTLPELSSGELAAALEKLRGAAPSLPEDVVSAKAGTLPAGRVGRWELSSGRTRALVYAVDAPGRHVVLVLTAPNGDFDRRANQLERSLSSLRLR